MKTITFKEFARLFNPNVRVDVKNLTQYRGMRNIEPLLRYQAMRDEWTALDILRLEDMPQYQRMDMTFLGHLIDEPIAHEFACRCAERALSRVEDPDERSVAAIEAKRKWLRNEISNKELYAAREAAVEAHWVTLSFTDIAYRAAMDAAHKDGWKAAGDATTSASTYVTFTAGEAEGDAEREWQVAELMGMLEGEQA